MLESKEIVSISQKMKLTTLTISFLMLVISASFRSVLQILSPEDIQTSVVSQGLFLLQIGVLSYFTFTKLAWQYFPVIPCYFIILSQVLQYLIYKNYETKNWILILELLLSFISSLLFYFLPIFQVPKITGPFSVSRIEFEAIE